MRILVVVNYYAPYVSGLTNVAKHVAEDAVAHGMEVDVLCYQHSPSLPTTEIHNGVRVHRVKPLLRLDRGIFSPAYFSKFRKLQKESDLVHLHAPLPEAGALVKLTKCPYLITYQCDVAVGTHFAGKILNAIVDTSSKEAFKKSSAIVVSSLDYAENSRLSHSILPKAVEIPPTSIARNLNDGTRKYRDGSGLHVGFLGRITEEKGLGYLVEGFRNFDDKKARLLIGGSFEGIAGSSRIDTIRRLIDRDPRIRILGFIPDEDVISFYKSIDVCALTSVNSFEAFGITQVEGMMLGIPAIASNLPGVRQPVLRTSMGWIVTPRSSESITECLAEAANHSISRESGREKAIELYGADASNLAYRQLYRKIISVNE